jgi:uroporphyrinogen-III synthase
MADNIPGVKGLDGVSVLVTRTAVQAEPMVRQLQKLGADVHLIPAIRIEPIDEPTGLKEILDNFEKYQSFVFTSVNGVNCFIKQLETGYYKIDELPPAVCVGPVTAARWKSAGGQVELLPERFTAFDVARALGEDLAGNTYILFRPEVVKADLGALLRKRGAEVREVILYSTAINTEGAADLRSLLNRGFLDIITYASPSAVRGVAIMAGGAENLDDTIALCIGPTTAETAMRTGLSNIYHPEEHTVDGMIRMIPSLVQN